MTAVPAGAIPGPEASAADVMSFDAAEHPEMVAGAPLGPDRSVSRNFLANLQHLASLKDRADLVQYGIMLMVEIATLEGRVQDAVDETTRGWRDIVVDARTARDKADLLVEQLRAQNEKLTEQPVISLGLLGDDAAIHLRALGNAIRFGERIDGVESDWLHGLADKLNVARATGGDVIRKRLVEEAARDG